MIKFGICILKVISKNNSIGEFVLYDYGTRGELLTEMLTRLTPDESSRFSIGQYTNDDDPNLPCIRLSPSSEYIGQYCFGTHTLHCILVLYVTPQCTLRLCLFTPVLPLVWLY